MVKQELVWQKARCPHCGQEYDYVIAYKPKTCGDFDCLQKELHPELQRNRGSKKYEPYHDI